MATFEEVSSIKVLRKELESLNSYRNDTLRRMAKCQLFIDEKSDYVEFLTKTIKKHHQSINIIQTLEDLKEST